MVEVEAPMAEANGNGGGGAQRFAQMLSSAHAHDLVDRKEAQRIEQMALSLSDQAPPWAAQALKTASPLIGWTGAGLEVVGPGIVHFYGSLYTGYTYLPKNVANCMWGVGMCFFGGRYAVSFAALEAFRATGGSQMLTYMKDIGEDITKLREANSADDLEDDDDNGIADVNEITGKQLVQRKTALFMRTVDPQRLSNALGGLWSGYMGMLAVLKIQFAKTVALAHSIGDCIRPLAAKIIAPTIINLTPVEYRQWVSPAINLGCKWTALVVAWRIQRTISSCQSGLKGGLLTMQSLLAFMEQQGWIGAWVADSLVSEIAGYSLAAGGIYYQVVLGGPVPLALGPILWPLGVVERALQWSVTYLAKDAPEETKG